MRWRCARTMPITRTERSGAGCRACPSMLTFMIYGRRGPRAAGPTECHRAGKQRAACDDYLFRTRKSPCWRYADVREGRERTPRHRALAIEDLGAMRVSAWRCGEWPHPSHAEPVGHRYGTEPYADHGSECQPEIGPDDGARDCRAVPASASFCVFVFLEVAQADLAPVTSS